MRAVDENGGPIKGVNVFAAYVADEMGRGPKKSVRTNDQGYAVISGLRPAEYLVVVAHPDYALGGQRILFTEPKEIQSLDTVMTTGIEVTGLALCSDHLPASGWKIKTKPLWWHSSRSWHYDDPVTDDGTFEFSHITPGPHCVTVSILDNDGGSISIWSTDVNLPPVNGLLELNIPKPSPHNRVNISGTITCLGDPPDRGFWIDAESIAGYPGSIYWNGKDESFTIPNLVPGLVGLSTSGLRPCYSQNRPHRIGAFGPIVRPVAKCLD